MRTAMEVLELLTPNTQTAMRTIFLRGESSVVYGGRESDNSSATHVLPLMRIFKYHQFAA